MTDTEDALDILFETINMADNIIALNMGTDVPEKWSIQIKKVIGARKALKAQEKPMTEDAIVSIMVEAYCARENKLTIQGAMEHVFRALKAHNVLYVEEK